jgi:hypothetical protein
LEWVKESDRLDTSAVNSGHGQNSKTLGVKCSAVSGNKLNDMVKVFCTVLEKVIRSNADAAALENKPADADTA